MYNNNYTDEDFIVCLDFMNNFIEFGESMLLASNGWKNTMLNHLTNQNINRVAFLGQCAVNHKLKYPCDLTKKCWKTLDVQNQNKANKIAYTIIYEWILKQKSNYMFQNGKNDAIKTGYQTKLNLS